MIELLLTLNDNISIFKKLFTLLGEEGRAGECGGAGRPGQTGRPPLRGVRGAAGVRGGRDGRVPQARQPHAERGLQGRGFRL